MQLASVLVDNARFAFSAGAQLCARGVQPTSYVCSHTVRKTRRWFLSMLGRSILVQVFSTRRSISKQHRLGMTSSG